MIRDINGLGSPITNKATKESRESRTESSDNSKKSAGSNAAPQAKQSGAQDEVEISNDALGLGALTDKVSNLPDVDIEKVTRIKTALENHEFNIDDLVIAEKLLNSDALLG